MTRQQAEALIDWLMDSAAGIAYGQASLTVIKHDGQVRLIEKTCTEKTQVPSVQGGAHGQ